MGRALPMTIAAATHSAMTARPLGSIIIRIYIIRKTAIANIFS